MKGTQEQELIAVKLRSLQVEATMQLSLKKETETKWFIRVGLAQTLTNVPRFEHLQAILKIVKSNEATLQKVFNNDDSVIELIDNCRQLYDIAFVIQNHVLCRNAQFSVFVLNRLQKKFSQFFNPNCDEESQLYLQGLRMYISLSQSSSKEPAASFITPIFQRQRKQCAIIYQWVFKPLFEKKTLKTLYVKLVGLVHWVVLMDTSETEIINDLSKKINSFILYYKNQDSIEMISVCNTLFDLLSVRFPKESNLHHYPLAALLVKLRNGRLVSFFEIWVEARSAFLSTIDFEYMFKTLTQMGFGALVVELLAKLWAIMRRTARYNVLLKLFSGYIRKQYLKLWMQRTQDLVRYIKIAKYFMVGLCNRERFEGQELDEITHNLCRHSINRGISLIPVSKEIVEFYSLYENRFSCLSETSKRFLCEIKQRSSVNIQTAAIHALFEQLTIRQLSPEEQEFWQRGKISYRYRGLQNLGNTCYMNSFMQALFMTKKFRGLIYQLTQDGSLPSNNLKTYALQNLFEELGKKQLQLQNAFRPEYFRMELASPFSSSPHQQDAAQFGRIYLQNLDKQLGPINGGLQKLLVQRLQKSIRCLRCGTEKRKDEKVFDLILSIQRNESELYLSKLLQRYFKPEKFTDDNKVFCSKCNNKEVAVSQLIPQKFSEVVALSLNLFDYVDEGRKILTPLIFEFSLNFQALLNHKEMGEYQLYAFIVHLGSNPSSGHYVCYARNLQQNPMVWYCMDDGYVTQRQISKAEQFGFGQNQTPYMLFYSRKAPPRGKA